ncbi:MAG TPA: MotA/TolQ/ExbB proton channel family protein [Gammaproteobacteria bacterium]|nr:MotA/TolQ/ExbB proton channel family protein [Gammaproteobacteria bacterium]
MSGLLENCRKGLVGAVALASLLAASSVTAQQPRGQQPAQPPAAAPPPAAPQSQIQLSTLRQSVQRLREQERQLAQEREQRFRAALQEAERAAQAATQRRNAAEARSNALDRAWNDNEQRIAETTALLTERQGNLGELFGVTRQVAGDAAGMLSQSLLTAQYGVPTQGEERADFLRRLAGATALPSITELERLWYEILREMTDGAKVVKFRTAVALVDDEATPDVDESQTTEEREVVRVGPFTASSNGEYLGFSASRRSLFELSGELVDELQDLGRQLQSAPPNAGYQRALVDPASGALLSRYVERPSWVRRIEDGEVVGYVIIFVGALGVLLAVVQGIYLLMTRLAVNAQLANLDNPKPNNPLGRVLLAYRGDGSKRIESAELAELRISEAVLREVPRLERFQSFLRLAVAAGPLLGLIGTVIGMIITFRAIVASGTSDPRLMAQGIGQAMIATVLGLGIAIPLLFINAGLASMSRSVTQILDEQSQALLAQSARERA